MKEISTSNIEKIFSEVLSLNNIMIKQSISEPIFPINSSTDCAIVKRTVEIRDGKVKQSYSVMHFLWIEGENIMQKTIDDFYISYECFEDRDSKEISFSISDSGACNIRVRSKNEPWRGCGIFTSLQKLKGGD